ncbi:MAG: hypothetical protein ACXVJP_18800 [Mucilaginibacter sp.]
MFFVYFSTSAQHLAEIPKPPQPPPPKVLLQEKIIKECSCTNKYNRAKRLAIYPFNKAVRVKLISFKEFLRTPVKNKVLDTQKVFEQVDLTSDQRDTLSGLLYNVGFTYVPGAKRPVFGEANCYEPRNAILFIDSSGKVFEYLEICFACHRTRKSSSKVHFGEFCEQKYDILKEFLSKAGISYGTAEQDPILKYEEISKMDTSFAISAIDTKLEKKTANGKNLNQLNEAEYHLFLLVNAEKIYEGFLLSGLAQFYSSISGNYYQQIIEALKEEGAYRTIKVMEASRLQWPGHKIPTDMAIRRKILFSIINKAEAHWLKLEKGLYNYKYGVGALYLIPKESIDNLIYKFVNLHHNELCD